MQHNLSTTIVEIDPAVYYAARRYFGMPEPGPGHIFLEDARLWVERRRKTLTTNDAPFDIIVHDCFSGGSVPGHLFTIEFWENLKSLMHEEGVLAIVS
jgi:spermidine synthase